MCRVKENAVELLTFSELGDPAEKLALFCALRGPSSSRARMLEIQIFV